MTVTFLFVTAARRYSRISSEICALPCTRIPSAFTSC